jgi:uncharacterized membrane protein (UPF0127 family)
MPWLLRDGEVLASAEVAADRSARRRGLLGRDSLDGALVLRPCRQVHTLGMRFPIDVVWCDRTGRVLRISRLRSRRVSLPVLRSKFVVEAEVGATDRWELRVGDVLEVAQDEGS